MRLDTKDQIAAHFLSFESTRDLGRGAAFPTAADGVTLAAGDRFFRTDVLYACVYDGTRWLTEHEYDVVVCAQTANTVAFDTPFVIVRNDGYVAYWTYAAVHTFCSPTNNASHYWTVALESYNAAITSGTTIASFPTSALAAGGNYVGLGVSTPLPSNRALTRAHITKTGAPSGISLTMTAYYRLVIT